MIRDAAGYDWCDKKYILSQVNKGLAECEKLIQEVEKKFPDKK